MQPELEQQAQILLNKINQSFSSLDFWKESMIQILTNLLQEYQNLLVENKELKKKLEEN